MFNQEVIAILPEEICKKEGNAAVCESDIWVVWTKATRIYTTIDEFVKFVCQYYILPIDYNTNWINKARVDFETSVRMQVQKPPRGYKDFIQKIGRHYTHQQVMKRLNDFLDKKELNSTHQLKTKPISVLSHIHLWLSLVSKAVMHQLKYSIWQKRR